MTHLADPRMTLVINSTRAEEREHAAYEAAKTEAERVRLYGNCNPPPLDPQEWERTGDEGGSYAPRRKEQQK